MLSNHSALDMFVGIATLPKLDEADCCKTIITLNDAFNL